MTVVPQWLIDLRRYGIEGVTPTGSLIVQRRPGLTPGYHLALDELDRRLIRTLAPSARARMLERWGGGA